MTNKILQQNRPPGRYCNPSYSVNRTRQNRSPQKMLGALPFQVRSSLRLPRNLSHSWVVPTSPCHSLSSLSYSKREACPTSSKPYKNCWLLGGGGDGDEKKQEKPAVKSVSQAVQQLVLFVDGTSSPCLAEEGLPMIDVVSNPSFLPFFLPFELHLSASPTTTWHCCGSSSPTDVPRRFGHVGFDTSVRSRGIPYDRKRSAERCRTQESVREDVGHALGTVTPDRSHCQAPAERPILWPTLAPATRCVTSVTSFQGTRCVTSVTPFQGTHPARQCAPLC